MNYQETVVAEVELWKHEMQRRPGLAAKVARSLQVRINNAIPEKVHRAVTTAIKQMTRAVCFGAEFTSPKPLQGLSMEERDLKAREKIRVYSNTASAEGAITGAGGILLGLADFPIWLTLKMKMLFELAAIYGFDVSRYQERIYLLHIFELTFSSQQHRNSVFRVIEDWENYARTLPADINEFNWRSFQQEYRDYIDVAKLLQLIPGIGAAVGAVVNHRLTGKLGRISMNAMRMRILIQAKIKGPAGEQARALLT